MGVFRYIQCEETWLANPSSAAQVAMHFIVKGQEFDVQNRDICDEGLWKLLKLKFGAEKVSSPDLYISTPETAAEVDRR